MASDKKMKSKKISERIAKNKKKIKDFNTEMGGYIAKRNLLKNPEVDASKFPGFDQANRIRGGLKNGGKPKLALRGGGRAYGKNS
jgi:hypothetical protein